MVPPGDLANSDISPDSATVDIGETVTFTATWTGLDIAMRWLGVITYAGEDSDGPVSSDTMTILSVGSSTRPSCPRYQRAAAFLMSEPICSARLGASSYGV